MARPPCSRKDLWLEDRQIEQLEALAMAASIGKPSFVSLVRQALDQFISHQLSNSATKEEVERYLRTKRVVGLHEVKK